MNSNDTADLTWREIALLVYTNSVKKIFALDADPDFSSLVEKELVEKVAVIMPSRERSEARIESMIKELSTSTFDPSSLVDHCKSLKDLIRKRPAVSPYHQLTEKGRQLIAAQTDARSPFCQEASASANRVDEQVPYVAPTMSEEEFARIDREYQQVFQVLREELPLPELSKEEEKKRNEQ